MLGEPTGIDGLDTITDGLSLYGLTLVLGAPGTGKTTLAMQIAAAVAGHERDVIYLSVFSESHEKLLAHLRPFSFFDETRVGTDIELLSLKSIVDGGNPDDLARTIFGVARAKRRPLLVLDGYRGMQALLGSEMVQRFLATLASQLPYLGASCLVTAEFVGLDAQDAPELTLADGVILLSRLHHGSGRYRMLEVTKLRGHAFREGPHGMAITEDGIVLYPRLAAVLPAEEPTRSRERQRFDLPAFDEMLGGGLPAHSTTIVSGEGGTGKTTLALQYLVAGTAADEQGLLVTFREPVPDLVRKATDLGVGLDSALERGLVRLLRLPPIELHPDEVAWRIVNEVQRHGITRVVIDGVRDLERVAGVLGPDSDYLASLLEYLRRAGTTTVMLHDSSGALAASLLTLPVAQNRVLLRRIEYRAQWYRVVSVLSMQASDHDTSIREFRIGRGGIRILDPSETAPDVLAGIASEQPVRGA
jgi:circadian clock protein KaiC